MFNYMNSNGDSKYKVSKHLLEDFNKLNFKFTLRGSMFNHVCDPNIHASAELSMGALIDIVDEE